MKPKAKKVTPKPVKEETGDKCERCGRFTDSIMQGPKGMFVCEGCLEQAEQDFFSNPSNFGG